MWLYFDLLPALMGEHLSVLSGFSAEGILIFVFIAPGSRNCLQRFCRDVSYIRTMVHFIPG